VIKALLKILGKRVKSDFTDFLADHVPAMQQKKATSLALSGRSMSNEEASFLEKLVADNPADLDARIALLGKYSRDQIHGGPGKQLRLRHIQWIIENRPEHYIAGLPFAFVMKHFYEEEYPRFRTLWLKQVSEKNNNTAVLINAASFFTHEDKETAEQLLLSALKILPSDRATRNQLAQLYSLWDGHEERALSEIEKLSKGRDSEGLFYDMSSLPSMAFEAGRFDKAVASANAVILMSEKHRNSDLYGGAINEAHTILGRVALINGDLAKAKYHLVQSVRDIASPTMCSFGPSLDLAKDLVNAGEKHCVLDYLDKCELLCGVNNLRAFKVRFAANHGAERECADMAENELFDQAFLDHQFKVLKAWSPTQRKVHLKKTIECTISSIEIWSKRPNELGERGNVETSSYARSRIIRHQDHLSRLNALLRQDGESET
jgi:hypothetical protein